MLIPVEPPTILYFVNANNKPVDSLAMQTIGQVFQGFWQIGTYPAVLSRWVIQKIFKRAKV